MENGDAIPIGRMHIDRLKEKVMEYMEDQNERPLVDADHTDIRRNCRGILGCEAYTQREDWHIPKIFLDDLYWDSCRVDSVSANLLDVFKVVADNNVVVLYHH